MVEISRVMVVDDDPFARTLIAQALRSGGLTVVAAVGSAGEALATARSQKLSAALLDLDLGPGPTGLELSIVLRREFPQLGIVFLTSYRDPRLLTSRWDNAPVGSRYLRKDTIHDSHTLVATLLQVSHNPQARESRSGTPPPLLTPTQLDVLKGVAEGRSTKELAISLGVSIKAIEASISRIHRILGLPSETGARKRVSLVNAFYAMTGGRPPRA